MKKIVRLTENDLTKLVKKVVNESKGLPSLDSNIGHRFVELMQAIKQYEDERNDGNYEKLIKPISMIKFRLNTLEDEINKIKDKLDTFKR